MIVRNIPEELTNKIYTELMRRESAVIRSKLYARCDMCYLCFNISELSIVEHEQTSKISDTPDEFLLKRFTQAETVRLICNRCLRDAAEKEV